MQPATSAGQRPDGAMQAIFEPAMVDAALTATPSPARLSPAGIARTASGEAFAARLRLRLTHP